MRVAILTTDTLHHAHYLKEITACYPVELVLSETRGLTAAFETEHAMDAVRDDHERQRFFHGADGSIRDYAEVVEVDSVNSDAAKTSLSTCAPDVVLVFGTGLIRPDVIGLCPDNMLNLHGGDPERYRGLDSHLWSLYHRDASGLVTTLHRVNPILDDGEIVLQEELSFGPDAGFEELRAVNTEACVRMSLAALDMFAHQGRIVSRPQRQVGRYYSFMPACLKDASIKNFDRCARKEA